MKVRFKLLRLVNLLLILVTLFAYLSPYVSPVQFWPLAFIGLMYPWLLLANVLFILFWASLKNRYAFFSVGCILLGWNHFISLVGFHTGSVQDTAQTIGVVSFNGHNLKHFKYNLAAVDPVELAGVFNEKPIDILCFQEFTGYDRLKESYADYLKKQRGLKNIIWQQGYDLALLTTYPVLKTQQKNFNRTNGYQFADLRIRNKIVRVFNIHLQSNAVSSIADRMAADDNLQEKEALRDVRTMAGRFKRAVQKRARQAEEVAAVIAKSPYPVIVCGDFNDIPQSYAYQIVSRGLQDAFKQKGGGIGVTYVGNVPGLRIDYILASPDFQVLDYEKRRTPFSDHRPVASILKLSE